jgi:hypothetical protein
MKKPMKVAGLRTPTSPIQPAGRTMSVRLSVPASTTTVRAEIASGIRTIICATSRIVPRIDHFELAPPRHDHAHDLDAGIESMKNRPVHVRRDEMYPEWRHGRERREGAWRNE